jgi:hypothetical protein
MTTTTFKLLRIVEERHYEVDGVDDLQDSTSSRRRVIRPSAVTLGMVPGKPQVRYASIKGRQVRADGKLADVLVILVGIDRTDATPPAWLNDLLMVEGLEWVNRHAVPTGVQA